MTKKDCIAIADIIKDADLFIADKDYIVAGYDVQHYYKERLISLMKKDNPKFDEEKFRRYIE